MSQLKLVRHLSEVNVSRSSLRSDARQLRAYAAALLGEPVPPRLAHILESGAEGVGVRQVAAVDLRALADDLDALAETDIVAVVDLRPDEEVPLRPPPD